MSSEGGARAGGVVEAAGRALFLACSWTWVIGMFLPVLLLADFGWPAWVAFALPNVAGAAVVGFVFATRGARAAFVERHEGAMRWFSIATVVFHVSFLSWFLITPFGWREVVAPGVALMALTIAWLFSSMRSRGWLVLAAAVFAASVVMLALAQATTGGRTLSPPPEAVESMAMNLLWLAPALAFGFLLCPHLDLTIQRQRLEAPGRTGAWAFILGFGVFFLAMITATLLYARSLGEGFVSLYLLGHILMQSTFTMGAHLRELRERGFALPRRAITGTTGRIGSVGLFMGLVVLALSTAPAREQGHARLVYDLFLSLYALVFPAYVWIVCVPRRRGMLPPLALWGASVVIAAPLMWLGAIEREWVFLAPGVAVPLLAPLAAWALPVRGGRDAAAQA